MPIQFPCANPQCQHTISCSDELAGQQTYCPQCGTRVQAPQASNATPAQEASGGKEASGPKIQQLGRYRLSERLGMGGMGTVYKAVDVSLNRVVALKILSSHLATNQKYVERFMREARSAGALNHANIVGALDVGQEGKYFYFAMEFIDGTTIQRKLKAQKKFPEGEAIDIVIHVGKALLHASRKNIIHRDIKPDNIMVSKDGEVKLTDLGLAKAMDSNTATITQAGRMVGTPHYASPEQIRGEGTIDGRTDIYSLGMTLYHMVVGAPAFDGPTAGVVTLKHLEEPFPDPQAACPELSDGLCQVLKKMTQKSPSDRYASAQELIEDLNRVKRGEWPSGAGPPPMNLARKGSIASKRQSMARTRKALNPLSTLGLVAVFLLAVGLCAYLFYSRDRDNSKDTIRVEETRETPQAQAERLGRALSLVENYARENPQNYPEIIDRLEGVKKNAVGTVYELRAHERIQTWLVRWDAAGQAEFVKRKEESEAHVKAGRIAQAVQVWRDFPEGLQTESLMERVSQEKGKLQALAQASETGAENSKTPATETLEVKETQPSAEGSLLEAGEFSGLLKAYKSVMGQLAPVLEQRDLSQAAKIAESLAALDGNAPLRPFLEKLRLDLPVLKTFLDIFLAALREKEGQEITISGAPAKLVSVGKDTVTVDFGGRQQEMPLTKFRAQDFLKIKGLSETAVSAEDALAFGLLNFCDKRFADASAWFTRANSANPASVYLEVINLAQEVEAQQEMDEIRQTYEKKNFKALEKMIKESVSKYGQTKVFQDKEQFIDMCQTEIGQARSQREQEMQKMLDGVEKEAAKLEASNENEYNAKKREVEEAYGKARKDSSYFQVVAVMKTSDFGFMSESLIVKEVLQPKDKKEKLEEIENILDKQKGLIAVDSWRKLLDAKKQLEKEIPVVKRKFEEKASKLNKEYAQKKQSLESRKKRMLQRIREGESITNDQVRAGLKGEK